MQNDLIRKSDITSARALNNKIKIIDMTPYISLEDLIEFIDNLPCAYDVEKVVAELEERAEEHRNVSFDMEAHGYSIIADRLYAKHKECIDVIKIVKGGVDNETRE